MSSRVSLKPHADITIKRLIWCCFAAEITFFIVADIKFLGVRNADHGKSLLREMFSVLTIASQPCVATLSVPSSSVERSKTVSAADVAFTLFSSRTKIFTVFPRCKSSSSISFPVRPVAPNRYFHNIRLIILKATGHLSLLKDVYKTPRSIASLSFHFLIKILHYQYGGAN